MIPKVIHYCWFGGGPKPAVFEKCLLSWKEYFPDYKIIEWNEENTDLSYCQFLRDAYDAKKWAFVSDVVRCLVVYEHGGIYMDTDVEVQNKKFNEYFQQDDAVFFFESSVAVNTGMGFGSVPKHPLLESVLCDYKETTFDVNRLTEISCPLKNTKVIKRFCTGLQVDGTAQRMDDVMFYSVNDYWSVAHHYGESSWIDERQKKLLKYAKRINVSQATRDKLCGTRIFTFFDRYNLRLIKRVYSFLVYDFIDYGPKYFFVRLISKFLR